MSGLIISIKIFTGIARILFWHPYADLAQFIHNTHAGHTRYLVNNLERD